MGEEVRWKSQTCGHQAGMSLTESVQTVSAGLGARSGVQLHLGRDEIEVVILALLDPGPVCYSSLINFLQ